MLKLDEKLIRKGRPVGLPYQGSKKKVAKQIVEIIKQNFGTDKTIYDVFGGGGALTAECLINGLNVKYSDADPIIVGMLQKVISTDREYIKSLIISRDEFFSIKEKQNKTIDDELKLLVNSFGNNRANYLYGKDRADYKYKAAMDIIRNHDVFLGYKQTSTYKQVISDCIDLEQLQQLQQLERLQQLQQLQQLERLQQLQQLQQLDIKVCDYRTFNNIQGAVFYCDPPYEGAVTIGYSISGFNSKAFYDWAYEMSKNNIVLISSYSISDDRFKPVFIFHKAKSSLRGGRHSDKCEKLFMV
ncbi:DNA adenine methylase [Mannheimia varigena]|nr:DNA adenine methylase [Mannheimia varigena]